MRRSIPTVLTSIRAASTPAGCGSGGTSGSASDGSTNPATAQCTVVHWDTWARVSRPFATAENTTEYQGATYAVPQVTDPLGIVQDLISSGAAVTDTSSNAYARATSTAFPSRSTRPAGSTA